jgi:hypothetical protein
MGEGARQELEKGRSQIRSRRLAQELLLQLLLLVLVLLEGRGGLQVVVVQVSYAPMGV